MGSFYRSQHEFIFVFKHGRSSHKNNVQLGRYRRHRSNVWSYRGINDFGRGTDEGNLSALHPTVKPVALVADAILDASSRGGIVLDPFWAAVARLSRRNALAGTSIMFGPATHFPPINILTCRAPRS
jgi:DNA methylase